MRLIQYCIASGILLYSMVLYHRRASMPFSSPPCLQHTLWIEAPVTLSIASPEGRVRLCFRPSGLQSIYRACFCMSGCVKTLEEACLDRQFHCNYLHPPMHLHPRNDASTHMPNLSFSAEPGPINTGMGCQIHTSILYQKNCIRSCRKANNILIF